MTHVCKVCGWESKSFIDHIKHSATHSLSEVATMKSSGVGWNIVVYILAIVIFTFIWAIFAYAIFPQLQLWQIANYPAGVYDQNQLTFVQQMVFWTPMVILWSLSFWLWNGAQKKTSGGDYPG